MIRNRYADAEAKIRDNERIAEIRKLAATQVERKFASVTQRASANVQAMHKLRGHLAPW